MGRDEELTFADLIMRLYEVHLIKQMFLKKRTKVFFVQSGVKQRGQNDSNVSVVRNQSCTYSLP